MSRIEQWGLNDDFLETYHETFDYDVGQVTFCPHALSLLKQLLDQNTVWWKSSTNKQVTLTAVK